MNRRELQLDGCSALTDGALAVLSRHVASSAEGAEAAADSGGLLVSLQPTGGGLLVSPGKHLAAYVQLVACILPFLRGVRGPLGAPGCRTGRPAMARPIVCADIQHMFTPHSPLL